MMKKRLSTQRKRLLQTALCLAFPLSLFPQAAKVIVTVERAHVYAEPHERSYLIEIVKRGTVLTLFQENKVDGDWYYVRFQSQRYGGAAMGFIKDTQVEPYGGGQPGQSEPPAPPSEKKPPDTATGGKSDPATKKPSEATKQIKEAEKPPVPEKKAVEEAQPAPKKPAAERKTQVQPAAMIEESTVDTDLPRSLSLELSQAGKPFDGRFWIQIDIHSMAASMPLSRFIQAPAPPALFKDRVWEIQQPPSKPAVALRGEKPPPDPIPRAKEESKPVSRELSERIALLRSEESLEITLRMPTFSSFQAFEVGDPNRVVIDFLDVKESAGFYRHRINDIGMKSIRVAMYQPDIARVVFDFTQNIPAYQIQQTDQGLKLLFWTAEAAGAGESEPRPGAETKAGSQAQAKAENQVDVKAPPSVRSEEVTQATAIPFPNRYNVAQTLGSEGERLFLSIDQEHVETTVPFPTFLALPSYYPPLQDTLWALIRTEDVPVKPQRSLELPPPTSKPAEKEPKTIPEKIPGEATTKQAPAKTQPESRTPDKKKSDEAQQVIPPPKQIEPPGRPHIQTLAERPSRLLIGLGYGASQGGAGGFLQYSLSKNLALHGGVGYFPTSLIYSDTDWVESTVLYSAGIKYYLPLSADNVRTYLDLQYGGITVEAVQVIEGIWNFEFIYRNEQQALFGPQALVGGEIRLGRFGLNAAAGVAYALSDWEWLPQSLYFTFDAGLLFYLK